MTGFHSLNTVILFLGPDLVPQLAWSSGSLLLVFLFFWHSQKFCKGGHKLYTD